MVVVQEGGPYHTEPLPKSIGGLVCKKLPKITSESVTNVRGMLRTFINQEEP